MFTKKGKKTLLIIASSIFAFILMLTTITMFSSKKAVADSNSEQDIVNLVKDISKGAKAYIASYNGSFSPKENVGLNSDTAASTAVGTEMVLTYTVETLTSSSGADLREGFALFEDNSVDTWGEANYRQGYYKKTLTSSLLFDQGATYYFYAVRTGAKTFDLTVIKEKGGVKTVISLPENGIGSNNTDITSWGNFGLYLYHYQSGATYNNLQLINLKMASRAEGVITDNGVVSKGDVVSKFTVEEQPATPEEIVDSAKAIVKDATGYLVSAPNLNKKGDNLGYLSNAVSSTDDVGTEMVMTYYVADITDSGSGSGADKEFTEYVSLYTKQNPVNWEGWGKVTDKISAKKSSLFEKGYTYYIYCVRTDSNKIDTSVIKEKDGVYTALTMADGSATDGTYNYFGIYSYNFFYTGLSLTNVKFASRLNGTVLDCGVSSYNAFTVTKDPDAVVDNAKAIVKDAKAYSANYSGSFSPNENVGLNSDTAASTEIGTKMVMVYTVSSLTSSSGADLREGFALFEDNSVDTWGEANYSQGYYQKNLTSSLLFDQGATYYFYAVRTGAKTFDLTVIKEKDGEKTVVSLPENGIGSNSTDITSWGNFGLYLYHYQSGATYSNLQLINLKIASKSGDTITDNGVVSKGDKVSKFTIKEQPASVSLTLNNADGTQISKTDYGYGAKVILPDGDNVVAYSDGDKLYNVGQEIVLTDDMVLKQTLFTISTIPGVSIRAVKDASGLRFGAYVNKEQYDALRELNIDIVMGILIAPTDYLVDSTVFTLEDSCLKANATKKKLETDGFAETKTIKINDEDVEEYVYYGSLVNVLDANLTRLFSGVAYATIEINGEEITVYGEVQENSLYNIAKDYIKACPVNPLKLVQDYVDSVICANVSANQIVLDADGSKLYNATINENVITVSLVEAGVGSLNNVRCINVDGVIYTKTGSNTFDLSGETITLTIS